MKSSAKLGVGFALASALLCCRLALPAKRIELWKPREQKPPDQEPQALAAAEETTATTESRAAKILSAAATQAGLDVEREVVSYSPEALQSPVSETGPASSLPGWLASEPLFDYKFIAVAVGEFKHPRGQILRAALIEFESAEEAWGLWSVGRGEKVIRLGQAANFGKNLRVWRGQFAAVLSLDPPDKRIDEVRLTKFGRVLFRLIPGRGSPPDVAVWLPTTNQLAHTVSYFHAKGPAGGSSMKLSAETEGATAIYRLGQREYRGTIVRYPDRDAALKAWESFVALSVGMDPTSGTRGSRRVGPVGGTWNGVRIKGRVGAFVTGAATRNQAEIFLAQALARARD